MFLFYFSSIAFIGIKEIIYDIVFQFFKEIFTVFFLVIFLVIALGFTIYIITCPDPLPSCYTSLIPVIYRTVTPM